MKAVKKLTKKQEAEVPEIRFKDTAPFKLKNNPPRRRFQGINLKKQFGFVPEIIVIEKLTQGNNLLFVRAVLTPEELEKVKKQEAEQKKELKKVTAKLDKLDSKNAK